jgi:tetrahydromethanopterin S-methyltransferase subunit D
VVLAAISWGSILYGALLSAIAAALLVFALRRYRRIDVVAAAALSGALGPFLWNAILHRVGGSDFFVDAPVAVVPASWQDTGSGVFAVAVAALVHGFGPARDEAGRRVALLSLLCGLGAFLVDVYLY